MGRGAAKSMVAAVPVAVPVEPDAVAGELQAGLALAWANVLRSRAVGSYSYLRFADESRCLMLGDGCLMVRAATPGFAWTGRRRGAKVWRLCLVSAAAASGCGRTLEQQRDAERAARGVVQGMVRHYGWLGWCVLLVDRGFTGPEMLHAVRGAGDSLETGSQMVVFRRVGAPARGACWVPVEFTLYRLDRTTGVSSPSAQPVRRMAAVRLVESRAGYQLEANFLEPMFVATWEGLDCLSGAVDIRVDGLLIGGTTADLRSMQFVMSPDSVYVHRDTRGGGGDVIRLSGFRFRSHELRCLSHFNADYGMFVGFLKAYVRRAIAAVKVQRWWRAVCCNPATVVGWEMVSRMFDDLPFRAPHPDGCDAVAVV